MTPRSLMPGTAAILPLNPLRKRGSTGALLFQLSGLNTEPSFCLNPKDQVR